MILDYQRFLKFMTYIKKLKSNNLLDLMILFLKPMKHTKTDEFVRFLPRKFQYVMVDEYQDTNHAQYVLINLLSEMHKIYA